MSKQALFPISDIRTPGRLRTVDQEWAKVIAVSVVEIGKDKKHEGMVQPVALKVHGKDGSAELVDGAHRLEAARMLGWDEIPFIAVSGSYLELRLQQIDANLINNKLNALVRANSQSGAFELMGNRYWCEALPDLRGHQLVVRFDPSDLHTGTHVYRLDGSYVGYADCLEAAGFNDVAAARKQNSARKTYMRAQREMLEAHRSMTIGDVADLMADPPSEPLPLEAKIVRPMFGASDPLMGRPEPVAPVARELDEAESAVLVELQTQFKRQPERVESDEQRFARAIKMERQIAAGIAVSAEDAAWLKSYQTSADYSARMLMFEDFGDAMLAAG